MKINENEMELNLNERLREVEGNQKSRVFKGMIHYLLFLTQNPRVKRNICQNIVKMKL